MARRTRRNGPEGIGFAEGVAIGAGAIGAVWLLTKAFGGSPAPVAPPQPTVTTGTFPFPNGGLGATLPQSWETTPTALPPHGICIDNCSEQTPTPLQPTTPAPPTTPLTNAQLAQLIGPTNVQRSVPLNPPTPNDINNFGRIN